MNEYEYLAGTVKEQLNKGRPLVLVSIVSMQGSTPRHGGTKMVVAADGQTYGTIGGSLIEAEAIRVSGECLEKGKSASLTYDLTGDASAPGMICGGQAELLLDYLPATVENQSFATNWHDAIVRGQDCYLLTKLNGDGDNVKVTGHAVLYDDGSLSADAPFTGADIKRLNPELHNITSTALVDLAEGRVMVDRIRRLKTLYCFGAGHVAVPTAHLAALVGFRVVVVDDRPEYANAERFPEAYNIIVTDDFDTALDGLDIDEDSFIVIVTRGHQYDHTVLEQSLRTSAGYIGMISSRRKRDAIYAALTEAGVAPERLEQVHSPIGLDIGGETPEEIAVSIVAELVRERSRKLA